ncbi:MAG TPA: XRE family transcriptional regulator [Xanthobacteraceae bacterium]|jgi:hypothetical protein
MLVWVGSSRRDMREMSKEIRRSFGLAGFRNSKQELLKAKLTVEIYKLLKKGGVTQTEAAKLLGTTQAQVSALMRCKPCVGIGRSSDGIPQRARPRCRSDREAGGTSQGRRYVGCRALALVFPT